MAYDLLHVLCAFPALGKMDTVLHHAGFLGASIINGYYGHATRPPSPRKTLPHAPPFSIRNRVNAFEAEATTCANLYCAAGGCVRVRVVCCCCLH